MVKLFEGLPSSCRFVCGLRAFDLSSTLVSFSSSVLVFETSSMAANFLFNSFKFLAPADFFNPLGGLFLFGLCCFGDVLMLVFLNTP